MTTACRSFDTPRGRGLACYPVKEMTVDTGRASATGVFAAVSQDRTGDVLEIDGIHVENHRKNPIVLWLHGFDAGSPDAQKPIGKCEDPSGNYTVSLHADQGVAIATTYFNQATQLAEQITELVMGKDIRAQSIGYRELRTARIYDGDSYIGSHLQEVELIEISWVPVPMNQDAVRSILSRQVAGKSLHPAIRSALAPYAGEARAWSPGFSFERDTMKTGLPSGVPMPRDLIDRETPKVGGSGSGAPGLAPAPRDVVDDGDDEKHGSKALRAFHKMLGYCALCGRKFADKLDDGSDTSATIHGVADELEDHADALKKFHASAYKDEDPLEDYDPDTDGGMGDGPAEAAAKTLSRAGRALRHLLDNRDEGNEELTEEEKAELTRLRRLKAQLNHRLRLRPTA